MNAAACVKNHTYNASYKYLFLYAYKHSGVKAMGP